MKTKTEPKELAQMKKLTKSLHTVTAATNVAHHLFATESVYGYPTAIALARGALEVLGYRMQDFSEDDATIAKIIRECAMIYATHARVAA